MVNTSMLNEKQPKALIVTGTRPEIIKMAPVYYALKRNNISVSWCHTGQHTSLAEQTFEVFDIEPDFILIRPSGHSVSDLVSGLISNISQLLESNEFDSVLVHGDTSSTLAGALAAFYNRVPVIAHVEAGLRSGDLAHPFPEESNRLLVAKVANLHFAPTDKSLQALLSENVPLNTVFMTGNTAIDAQYLLLEQGKINSTRKNKVLVTAHRRENWENIPVICDAVIALSKIRTDLEFVFAVHPNPELKMKVGKHLEGVDRITLTEPLDYFSLQRALSESVLVMTDSGGIQEEAPTFGTPVLVLRETTERPEAIEQGYSSLCGGDNKDKIVEHALKMLELGQFKECKNPFGDGTAAIQIAETIVKAFNELS
ncbi:non-hydrolyzing UDP-N-acetylglucosamine 2-epimerase [Vibrio amylolyticus]|uniref:non-hydrolyzing UDP-N-acetylglucosamine 2-epimerase n=1 Tax=Vibrio amylolyticus TaxID=2847292 RepID=UPI00354D066E